MVIREAVTREEKLIQRCATKILENTNMQLDQVVYFRDNQGPPPTIHKMRYTPLTNSASESRIAQLDLKVKFSGGAAPVQSK